LTSVKPKKIWSKMTSKQRATYFCEMMPSHMATFLRSMWNFSQEILNLCVAIFQKEV